MSPHFLQSLLDPITSSFSINSADYELISNASFYDDSVKVVIKKHIKPYFKGFSKSLKNDVIEPLIGAKNKKYLWEQEFDLDEIILHHIEKNSEKFIELLYEVIIEEELGHISLEVT